MCSITNDLQDGGPDLDRADDVVESLQEGVDRARVAVLLDKMTTAAHKGN